MKKLIIFAAIVMGFTNCATKRIEVCGMNGQLVPELHQVSGGGLENKELPHTNIKSTLVDTIPIRKLPK
jgi:hypothetical protein